MEENLCEATGDYLYEAQENPYKDEEPYEDYYDRPDEPNLDDDWEELDDEDLGTDETETV